MDNARLRVTPTALFVFAGLLAVPFVTDASSLRVPGSSFESSAAIGSTDFTIELWMRGLEGVQGGAVRPPASAAENDSSFATCDADADWTRGPILVDRDRMLGVAITDGRVVFGVRGGGRGDRTICGRRRVLDDAWHHIAVDRRRLGGRMRIWIDGVLDAEADGPDGGWSGGSSLVFGGSFVGHVDEIRVSTVLRYRSSFTRPRAPFAPDSSTAALHHLDSGPEWSSQSAPLGGGVPVELTLVTGGLSEPIQVVQPPNDASRLFIVEQGGTIRIYTGGSLLPTPFLDISPLTSDGSEQGLLSMAFDPDYASSGHFYVYYTDDIASPGDITIARYAVSADPDVADENSAQILLVIPHPTHSNHNGGLLMFGPDDGYLYIGTGDGGSGGDPDNNAQNINVLLGKMLRIDVDGTNTVPCGQSTPRPYGIPASNPFVGQGGCDEIWSYGLRNPWRFSFDRETGDLFIGDVGQNLWEEINYQPGTSTGEENWGWRRMEGFHCYNPTSNCNDGTLELPILEYGHGLGCSVTGGFRYRGSEVPGIVGSYLYGDYCTGRIWEAVQDGGGGWTSTEMIDTSHNISGWGEDLAGEIYLCAHGGSVYKLTRPPNPLPELDSLDPLVVIAGDPGFTLTVDGAGFVFESVIRWNGADLPTTFVSDNRLTAAIAASDIQTPGTADVTVFSPGPGGGVSETRTLFMNLTFLDVPTSHFAYLHIAAVFEAGVTAGCGPRIYCPDVSTTRAQMAPLLLKASLGAGYTPPPCSGAMFADVLCSGGLFDPWIEDLASRGITAGCGGGNYCPSSAVTRAQMAPFLLKTDLGASYTPPPCSGTLFSDVPCTGGIFDPWIEDLAGRGITGGCGGGNYCPSSAVTRAQMAVFLTLTFNLPLP